MSTTGISPEVGTIVTALVRPQSVLDAGTYEGAICMVRVFEIATWPVRGWGRASIVLKAVSFVAIFMSPHVGRLSDSSLFSDDVTSMN